MRHIPAAQTSTLDIPPFEESLREALKAQTAYDEKKWLYVPCVYGEYRYVLGTRGEKPLVCIGINPSTASPDALDPTLKSVQRTALGAGYDSFIMLNLYAQRATDPDEMERNFNPLLHEYNMAAFSYILDSFPRTPDIWAAWGAIIEKRAFLYSCVADAARIAAEHGALWYTCGKRSKDGHPHHPLYLKAGSPLEAFDIDAYIRKVLPRDA